MVRKGRSRRKHGFAIVSAVAARGGLLLLAGTAMRPAGATDFNWTNLGVTGLWDAPPNWDAGVGFPNSINDSASFGSSGIGSVTLDGPKTVNTLRFLNASGSFVIGPSSDTLTIDNGAGGGTLSQSGSGVNTLAARLQAQGLLATINGGTFILGNTTGGAGANSVAGMFTVGAGATLEGDFDASNALGSAGVTLAGGTLRLQGVGAPSAIGSLGNNVTVTDNSTLSVAGAAGVNLGAVSIMPGKTLTVDGSAAVMSAASTTFTGGGTARTLTFNVTGNNAFALGQINDNAIGNKDKIVKTGAGQLVVNTPTGSLAPGLTRIDVNQGRLVLQKSQNQNNSFLTGFPLFLNGANTALEVRLLSGAASFSYPITISDDAMVQATILAPIDGQPHSVTLASPINVTAPGKTLALSSTGDVLQISGVISGTNITLLKTGDGTVDLNAANTYSGTTSIAPDLGFLKLSKPGALGSSSLSLAAGERLEVNAALTGSGPLTISPGSYLRLSDPNVLFGTQLTPASIPAGANVQLNAAVSNIDQINPVVAYYVVSTPNFLTFSAPINLNHDNFIPQSGVLTNLATDVSLAANINVGSNGATIAASTGTTMAISGLVNAGSNVVTIGSLTPIDGLAKSGAVRFSQIAAGRVNVVSGVLGGRATITSDVNTGLVDVASGAQLSPGDTRTGVFTIKTSSPSPGSGVNSTLWLEPDSILSMKLDSQLADDRVEVTGTVDVAGALLRLTLLRVPNPGQQIRLLLNDASDPIQGTFAGLSERAIIELPFNGQNYDFALTYHANLDFGVIGNDLGLTAVPEPATAIWAAGCIVLALTRRRRYRV
jgi:autotransporter-associated beta strand protein